MFSSEKNLYAGLPSSIIKIDEIIWESAEESVQITNDLLESWSGRYSPAAKKFFDICKGENESIRKTELSKCGAKVLEDFNVDQSKFITEKNMKFLKKQA